MKILAHRSLYLLFLVIIFVLAGCSLLMLDKNVAIKSSPHFNKSEDRFENTDGTANEKSMTALLGLALEYFNRPEDPNEASGFDVLVPNAYGAESRIYSTRANSFFNVDMPPLQRS